MLKHKARKLGKLKPNVYAEGFLSCDSFEGNEFLAEIMQDDSTGIEVNMHLYDQKGEGLTQQQQKFEEDELNDIDEMMENLVDDYEDSEMEDQSKEDKEKDKPKKFEDS